ILHDAETHCAVLGVDANGDPGALVGVNGGGEGLLLEGREPESNGTHNLVPFGLAACKRRQSGCKLSSTLGSVWRSNSSTAGHRSLTGRSRNQTPSSNTCTH